MENLAPARSALSFGEFSFGREEMNEVRDALRGADVVYHLAADATEGRSQFTPWRCTMDGLAASVQVFAAAAAVGVKRIVFTSSMAVYGDQQPPFTEEMEPRPVDIYGVMKAGAERCLQILAETHGFEYVILRPHNVFGPRQRLEDPFRNVVGIFANRLMRGLPMVIYGDGGQERAFSYIGDVIGPIAEAGIRAEVANQVFNVGTDQQVTVRSLAELIACAMGMTGPAPVEHVPERPREVRRAWADNSLWWRTTGQEPPAATPLGAGLSATVAWARNLGPQEPRYVDLEISSEALPETWAMRSL